MQWRSMRRDQLCKWHQNLQNMNTNQKVEISVLNKRGFYVEVTVVLSGRALYILMCCASDRLCPLPEGCAAVNCNYISCNRLW